MSAVSENIRRKGIAGRLTNGLHFCHTTVAAAPDLTNSRQKGARGEREFAKFLRERGVQARRGQQFSGSPDSPDVITDLEDYHFEVKRVESFRLYVALDQAKNDAGDKVPIVAHRKNNREWVVIMDAKDFLNLAKGE